jgi:signal transduction histidine kinase
VEARCRRIEAEMAFDRVVELASICSTIARRGRKCARVSPIRRRKPALSIRGEMRRSDESVLKFLTRPLPDGATLVAFQDITADRRVEDALRERAEAFEQADKLKGQFVENVSYQLRNPLQAIYGNAELLQHACSAR